LSDENDHSSALFAVPSIIAASLVVPPPPFGDMGVIGEYPAVDAEAPSAVVFPAEIIVRIVHCIAPLNRLRNS
jgi:hypothetical protein